MGEFNAENAIGPDFNERKLGLINLNKSQFFKKSGFVCKGKNFSYFISFCFDKNRFSKQCAYLFSDMIGMHGKRAYFSKIFPAELQGAASYDFTGVIRVNNEIPEMII